MKLPLGLLVAGALALAGCGANNGEDMHPASGVVVATADASSGEDAGTVVFAPPFDSGAAQGAWYPDAAPATWSDAGWVNPSEDAGTDAEAEDAGAADAAADVTDDAAVDAGDAADASDAALGAD